MQRSARIQTSSQAACDARTSTGKRMQRPVQAIRKQQPVQTVEAGNVAAAALTAAVLLTSAAALPAWADDELVELPAAAKAIAQSFSGYNGMTKSGKQKTPEWLQKALGVEVPETEGEGKTLADLLGPVPKSRVEEKAKKEEEERKRQARKRKKGRLRELEEIRAELAEKELILLQKEQELLDKEQTLLVLKEELELERKLRALLTKEKERAEEEAALAMGLCTGGAMLP
eukprot:gene10730-10886_t